MLNFSVEPSISKLAAKHTDFDSFMEELEAEPSEAEGFREAGTWVAERFYQGEGLTLRTARLRKGYSQKQLAALLGTSQPHVANMERCKGEIFLSTAVKLCEHLGIPLDKLPEIIDRQKQLFACKEGK